MKFTKGPWKLLDFCPSEYIYWAIVADGEPGKDVLLVPSQYPDTQEHREQVHADMRLMAAAPEMYKALEDVCNRCPVSDSDILLCCKCNINRALCMAKEAA